jgi:hypothetical protein
MWEFITEGISQSCQEWDRVPHSNNICVDTSNRLVVKGQKENGRKKLKEIKKEISDS